MPRANIYVRLDNWDYWKEIDDKSEWLNSRINDERFRDKTEETTSEDEEKDDSKGPIQL